MSEERLRQEAVRRRLTGESPAEIADALGRSTRWVRKWVARHQEQTGSDSWAQSRSRAPLNSPGRTPANIEHLILEARERLVANPRAQYGSLAIQWELRRVGVTDIPPWSSHKLQEQLSVFPQGQIVAENENGLVGCASSLIVLWDDWSESHNWKEITGAGTFANHNPHGRTLYGAEIFVDPTLRGEGIGHLLYEGRRALCRAMNLKRIIACGRLPGYHHYVDEISAEFYAQKVVWGDLTDPVLSFQIKEGFSYCRIMENYIPEDNESCGNAALIVWLNPDYNLKFPTIIPRKIIP